MSAHVPLRPRWTCAGCDTPWPCDTRKQELAAEYAGARVALSLFMAACMIDAMGDLPAHRGSHLHARFLGWLPR